MCVSVDALIHIKSVERNEFEVERNLKWLRSVKQANYNDSSF
jgi:hypothetical protein